MGWQSLGKLKPSDDYVTICNKNGIGVTPDLPLFVEVGLHPTSIHLGTILFAHNNILLYLVHALIILAQFDWCRYTCMYNSWQQLLLTAIIDFDSLVYTVGMHYIQL